MVTDKDRELAGTLLKKMFKGSHFSMTDMRSICTIMEISESGFECLRKYHCVNWCDMPLGMQDEIFTKVMIGVTRLPLDAIIDKAMMEAGKQHANAMLQLTISR